MFSLIYVSVANPDITQKQVEALAVHSARKNDANNLTGMLAYNTRDFMQLLEGDEDVVRDVMASIEKDERHSDVRYVRQEHRAKRECPNWSMQSLIVPFTGIGSAEVFTNSLPGQMELDTKILFTSFASSLKAVQAA